MGEGLRTAALEHETEDIAEDKGLGEPPSADDRVFLAVCKEDDTSENHVDGRGEEGGCDENVGALDAVGHHLPFAVWLSGGGSTSAISSEFNCLRAILLLAFYYPCVSLKRQWGKCLRNPPITNAIRYQVFVLIICSRCRIDVTRKSRANMMAAATDGW